MRPNMASGDLDNDLTSDLDGLSNDADILLEKSFEDDNATDNSGKKNCV